MAKKYRISLKKHGISEFRHLELVYFCLQHGERERELTALLKAGRADSSGARRLARLIGAVDRTATAADAEIGEWIKIGVTRGFGYGTLVFRYGMPAGRDKYYAGRRRFFILLSKRV